MRPSVFARPRFHARSLAAALLAVFPLATHGGSVRAAEFDRGDSNADGRLDISDATSTLGCLFLGSQCPSCAKAADSNDDGAIDLSDAVIGLAYLFLGGPELPAPFGACGIDPTPDDLDCVSYPPCPGAPGDEPAGEGESSLPAAGEDAQGETDTSGVPIEETEGAEGLLQLRILVRTEEPFELIRLRLRSVEISADGAAWLSCLEAPLTVGISDLDRPEGLPPCTAPAGAYGKLRVVLGAVERVADGSTTPVPFPEDTVLDVAFSVEADRVTALTLDLSLDPVPPVLRATASVEAPPLRIARGQIAALDALRADSSEPVEARFAPETAVPSYLGGDWPSPAADPGTAAVSFLRESSALFGLETARDGFDVSQVRRSTRGWAHARLRQTSRGIPVHAGELVVHFADGRLRRLNGRFYPDVDGPTAPEISEREATAAARSHLESLFRGVSIESTTPPALTYLPCDARGLPLPDGARLCWSLAARTLSPAGNWLVFVDASTGDVLSAENLAEGVAPSRVYDAENTSSTSDDTLWYEDEVKQTTGTVPGDVALLESYIPIFHDYLETKFGLDSIDDGGMRMVARANDPAAASLNACWDCRDDETIYLPGWVTLDVVGHEFTHGVVSKSAGGLGEIVEARTLNEANADIFAELCDCWNSTCNWLVGTDHFGVTVPGDGVVRDLSSPTVDHLSKYDWATTSPYKNIGIPSKVAYLLAAGGTHKGVTVSALGISKAEQLLFATLLDSGLSKSATFAEYRDVMLQTCREMVGGPEGITSTDCRSVYRAWSSVGYGALSQPVVGALNESSDYFGYRLAEGDFNGDGYRDLVVSAPWEDYAGKEATGAAFVFYGSSIGLQAGGAEILVQSDSGGVESSGDRYGEALAVGDFNGDSYDDLAVGTPGNNNDGKNDAGMVRILYGSSVGLENGGKTPKWEAFGQSFANGAEEAGDEFGRTLAAGDFDGDGFDDLAVGSPLEDVGSTQDAGIVWIFYGRAQGLLDAQAKAKWEGFTQTMVEAANEKGDKFGSALAAGDFNDDGRDDLAVGVPHEDVGSAGDTGVVNIVFGSSQGLIRNDGTMSWERISQSSVGGSNEDGDRFAAALAAGDFDGDGRTDLAVGSPGEALAGKDDAGMVTILYGSSVGLYPPSWERFDQSFVDAAVEKDDEFGATLAVGNLNGDGYDELVIGVPDENFAGYEKNGVVFILWGGAGGLLPATWQVYGQAFCGGDEADYDRFGFAVAVGDFDADGEDDLAASAPWEDFPDGVSNGGAVYVKEY